MILCCRARTLAIAAILLILSATFAQAQAVVQRFGPVVINVPSITSTSTSGLSLTNDAPSTTGSRVQFSPRINLSGSAWDTDDSISRALTAYLELQTASSTVPYGNVVMNMIEAGGAVTQLMLIQSFNNVASTTYNTGVGGNALHALTTGYYNNAFGLHSLFSITTGFRNSAMGINAMFNTLDGADNNAYGFEALKALLGGTHNVAIGNGSQVLNQTGAENTGVGSNSIKNNVSGSFNTGMGKSALHNALGSNNVGLGYFAGAYETGSDAFYVDDRDRSNTANDKAKALLYGTFNATAASQTLLTNSAFTALVSVKAPTYIVGTTTGASCALAVPAHLTVVNGIVTVCN